MSHGLNSSKRQGNVQSYLDTHTHYLGIFDQAAVTPTVGWVPSTRHLIFLPVLEAGSLRSRCYGLSSWWVLLLACQCPLSG